MAQDGLLFKWVARRCTRRYRTPGRAIVLQAVWAAVLVLTGTYRELFTRVIYTEWIFFALLGDRRRAAAPARRLRAALAHAGRAADPDRVCAGVVCDRVQSDSRRSGEQRHRTGDGACRAAGVLDVGEIAVHHSLGRANE